MRFYYPALSAIIALSLLAAACAGSGTRAQYARKMVKSYESMKPGDWTSYELTRDIGVMLYVTKVFDDHVIIRRHQYFQNMPVQGDFPLEFYFQKIKKNLLDGKDLEGKINTTPPEISQETVEAAGTTFNCTVYTVKTPGMLNNPGAVISTYVSDKVPMDGVVMVRRNHVIVRLLKSFGRAGEPVTIPAR